jgi:hypothetical protein
MALRLTVEGCSSKVREFIDHLRTLSPKYRFYDESKLSSTSNESRIEYYLDVVEHVKPKLNKRAVYRLKITAKDGENIELVLLDAEIVDMGHVYMYIHGKNYDVYSTGKKT